MVRRDKRGVIYENEYPARRPGRPWRARYAFRLQCGYLLFVSHEEQRDKKVKKTTNDYLFI